MHFQPSKDTNAYSRALRHESPLPIDRLALTDREPNIVIKNTPGFIRSIRDSIPRDDRSVRVNRDNERREMD